MKTRVALNCNNLQSSDPVYTYLGEFVNEAANRIILIAASSDKRAVNVFPELRDRSWSDITVASTQAYDLPTDLLVLDSVKITQLTTTYNPATQTEYPVVETDVDTFATLSKSATGFPTMWCRAGSQIKFWPTPTTAYLTRVVLRGILKETAMSGSTDTLVMDSMWHPAVIDYATGLCMDALGWDDAEKWFSRAKEKVTEIINPVGLERRKDRMQIRIAGAA
jgi:hypothetical protein